MCYVYDKKLCLFLIMMRLVSVCYFIDIAPKTLSLYIYTAYWTFFYSHYIYKHFNISSTRNIDGGLCDGQLCRHLMNI